MKRNGGQAIAVYNPDDPQRAGFKKCYQLSAHADRVKQIAPADYRPNTHLRMLLEEMVEETANRIVAIRKEAIETGTVRAAEILIKMSRDGFPSRSHFGSSFGSPRSR